MTEKQKRHPQCKFPDINCPHYDKYIGTCCLKNPCACSFESQGEELGKERGK